MKKGRKIRAAVDIEMILMISLSVAALFLIFNLFNTNLARITANKNINDLSPENTLRTEYKPIWDKDPTQTQVNVQIVGDHGLQWYHEQAQYTIESLGSKPAGSLADDEWESLAKALTVFGESVPNGQKQYDIMDHTCLGAQPCTGSSDSYSTVAQNHGITVDWDYGNTLIQRPNTLLAAPPTNWIDYLSYPDARPQGNKPEEQRVQNIKDIKNGVFNLP